MKRILIGVFISVILTPAFGRIAYYTEPASQITTNSAQLNGSAVSTNTPVAPSFQLGTTKDYGYNGAANPQKINGEVSMQIKNLHYGTTYHFKLYGTPGMSPELQYKARL